MLALFALDSGFLSTSPWYCRPLVWCVIDFICTRILRYAWFLRRRPMISHISCAKANLGSEVRDSGYAQCKTVQNCADSTAQFLDRLLTRPSSATTGDGDGPDSACSVEVAVAVYSTVVDFPVVPAEAVRAQTAQKTGDTTVQFLMVVHCAHRCATTGARGPSFCSFIPASWPMRLWPRSSSTTVTCSWLVLLVAVYFALFPLIVGRPRIFGHHGRYGQ